ncbi:hypothetical protein RND81_03G104000 [Saponaria officinalis]|uniref:Uncharacterized protein n=1 Tax=Saponaria officinalis TaxID=3572 RepID=A0AAW1M6J7_SAPOF
MIYFGTTQLEELFWKKVDDGVELLATPKVDDSIVRVEEEEDEGDVVEVIVLSDDKEDDVEVLVTPPKSRKNTSVETSPCAHTPDVEAPKLCRKRARKNYPKRPSNKRLRFDDCVGCSH